MTEWTDYSDSAELVSAEANLDNAADQSSWADWHAATGDEYAQWADRELAWAEDCLREGYTESGEQALANAAADLGTAGDEYADAAWAESNAETYTEWAAADLDSASYDSSYSSYDSASYDSSYSSSYDSSYDSSYSYTSEDSGY